MFLSRFFKEPKFVWQRFSLPLYVYCISAFLGTQVFAAQGVELKDEELDNVYAEGFSFNLDISIPKTQDLINKAIADSKSKLKSNQALTPAVNLNKRGNNILLVGGNSQKYLSSLVNVNAVGSIVPVMLNIVVSINSIISNLTNANKLSLENNYDLLPSPAVANVNPAPAVNIAPAVVVPSTGLNLSQNAVIQPIQPIQPSALVVPSPAPVTANLNTEPAVSSIIPYITPSVSNQAQSNPVESSALALPSVNTEPVNIQPAVETANNILPSPSNTANLNQEPAASIVPYIAPAISNQNPIAAVEPSNIQPVTESANSILSTPVTASVNQEPAASVVPNAALTLPSVNIESNNIQPAAEVANNISQQMQPLTNINSSNAVENVPLEITPAVITDTGSAVADNPPVEVAPISGVNNFEAPFVDSGSGLNMVVVDAQSQQYLSSLVNVNSAGSVVPILINLIININSKIENMSNSNNIETINNFRYRIH